MADAFQPRFVDLVRNYTSTIGTGDLVLAEAAVGFTSFAAALQAGDRFYYSVTGIDRPAETEVGRGTLQADGTIKREPIAGTLTNFSDGTKSVALVAAAEWLESVQSGQAGSPSVSTREELATRDPARGPAILAEQGREGIFSFDSADVSSAVGADAAQGVHVAPAGDPSGASGAWVRKVDGFINAKWFGAVGNSDLTGQSGHDDTAAIQAAIDFIDSRGGGTLFIPEGYYRITTYLTLCKNLHILGAGRTATWIAVAAPGGGGANPAEDLRNGTAFYSNWPSNSSTPVHINVENIGFMGWSEGTIGAAFYDNCGTTVTLRNCEIQGFKYGAVFDQTELGDIDLCEFMGQSAGGAGVYLVNGPTLTAANASLFTNRVSVKRCQFNGQPESYGILDEGGYTHAFVDNNYNGCKNHIYAAGVQGLKVSGGEFEGSSDVCVQLDYRRAADLSGVGGGTGVISGAFLSSSSGCINIASASGPYTIEHCLLSRSDGGAPLTGTNNAGALHLRGNLYNSATAEAVDGRNIFLTDDRVQVNVRTNIAQAALGLTRSYANCLLRCTNATGNQLTIQADSAGPTALMPIGTIFMLEQSTAAGPVTLLPAAGVTIAGPRSTTRQYQVLMARKIAANSWQTFRMSTPPETGWAADTGTSKTSANATYSGTAEADYTQATVQALMDAVRDISQTQKALKDALISQGIIGA